MSKSIKSVISSAVLFSVLSGTARAGFVDLTPGLPASSERVAAATPAFREAMIVSGPMAADAGVTNVSLGVMLLEASPTAVDTTGPLAAVTLDDGRYDASGPAMTSLMPTTAFADFDLNDYIYRYARFGEDP